MCSSGLDLLELGVPFSDPTADGPVIQRSSARAIKAGVNMKSVVEMVSRIREFSSVPIIVFTYYNPILAYGAEEFYRDAVEAGADGTWWWTSAGRIGRTDRPVGKWVRFYTAGCPHYPAAHEWPK